MNLDLREANLENARPHDTDRTDALLNGANLRRTHVACLRHTPTRAFLRSVGYTPTAVHRLKTLSAQTIP